MRNKLIPLRFNDLFACAALDVTWQRGADPFVPGPYHEAARSSLLSKSRAICFAACSFFARANG
jgi:hypothetical protein